MKGSLIFKRAEYDWELEKVHELNYETFVEEIPQHEENCNRALVDKFDNENTYFISLKDEELLGMISIRDKRPFSLDKKIDNLDSYLPQSKAMCEVRLLSVKKDYRNGVVLSGLLKELYKYIKEQKYDLILISGILNQQKLYRHMGFIPFGPIVGNEDAKFQPMYMTNESSKIQEILKVNKSISFLPGPVEISSKVKEIYSGEPVSHRAKKFKDIFKETKKELCKLVGAKNVEIFMGCGTLANDMISAQLSLIEGRGMVLSNGEFGERLIDHAKGFKLSFKTYRVPYGETFNSDNLKNMLEQNKDIKWLYMVHCETSTGVLNDIQAIQDICKNYNVLLCLDCISSIGNVDIDISNVYMASATSGKGLASYCGLGMVFYNHELLASKERLPRCLDLYKYKNTEGIPYTISSSLVFALNEAVNNVNIKEKVDNTKKYSHYLRTGLEKVGMKMLIEENTSNPSVITIVSPQNLSSRIVGDYLKGEGILVSYESSYLLENNWFQVCFMGELSNGDIETLMRALKKISNRGI